MEKSKKKNSLKIIPAFISGFVLGLLISKCPDQRTNQVASQKQGETIQEQAEKMRQPFEKTKETGSKEKRSESTTRAMERAIHVREIHTEEITIPVSYPVFLEKEFLCDDISFSTEFIKKPPKLWNKKTAEIVFSVGMTSLVCLMNDQKHECEHIVRTKLRFDEDGKKNFSVVFSHGRCEKKLLEYSFIVDTTPPETRIIPVGFEKLSVSHSVDFRFETSEPVRSILCKLDEGAWMDCTRGKIQLTNVEDGWHTIYAYSIDLAGNVEREKKSYRFEVDAAPPKTIILEKPPKVVRELPVIVKFTSNKKDVKFECSIDGGDWLPCFSPMKIVELSPGLHTVKIRTIDKRGRVEQEPVIFSFTFRE